METKVLELIKRRGDNDLRVAVSKIVDDFAKLLLANFNIHERVVEGKRFVEQCATKRGLKNDRIAKRPTFLDRCTTRRHDVLQTNLDLRLQMQRALIVRHQCFCD